jgi:hypothetical protein
MGDPAPRYNPLYVQPSTEWQKQPPLSAKLPRGKHTFARAYISSMGDHEGKTQGGAQTSPPSSDAASPSSPRVAVFVLQSSHLRRVFPA